MNEFSNVRNSYFKLKVMYTYFEDNRERNLTANTKLHIRPKTITHLAESE